MLHSPMDLDPARLQRLLAVLEGGEHAGDGKSLPIGQLLGTWRRCCLLDSRQELQPLDFEIMSDAVTLYADSMQLDLASPVVIRDFSLFLTRYSRAIPSSGGRLKWRLQTTVAEDPGALNAFLQDFCSRRGIPNGVGLSSDLVACISELAMRYCEVPASPYELASDLLWDLSLDDHCAINLWEAIGLLLGRQTANVELLLYDISYGASRLFSPLLLGQSFEAIYHSSVLVFGAEYWYGGHVFESDPPIDPRIFGPPLTDSLEQLEASVYKDDLRVVHQGFTLATLPELRAFLHRVMKPRYGREHYDVLSHNCNHFSEEVVRFLTGKSIPVAVGKLSESLMSTPAAKRMRPFLNRWLRSFKGTDSADEGNHGDTPPASEADVEMVLDSAEFRSSPGIGTEEVREVDMGPFDPTEAEVLQRRSSRRELIKRDTTGDLVRVKSQGSEPSVSSPSQMRRQVKREAIKRLGNGLIVNAKIV